MTYLSAEELRDACVEAGIPVSASIEPSGRKLAEYWTKGEGAAKIRWGAPGDFNRCVTHLGKFVKDPKGLCAEYHKLALGAWPGKGHAHASAVLFRLAGPNRRGVVVSPNFVTAGTVRANDILAVGDRFEVRGPDAIPYPAQVVDLQSFGDEAARLLVCEPVRQHGGAAPGTGYVDHAVTLRIGVTDPQPMVVASASEIGQPLRVAAMALAQRLQLDPASLLVPMAGTQPTGQVGLHASSETAGHTANSTWRTFVAEDWLAVPSTAFAAAALTGKELARPGRWKLSTGEQEFTDQMLRDAADFYAATGGQGIPIGLGHNDTRFDGDPTFGRVTNIRYTQDERGPVLLGDLVDLPEWLAAAAPTRWPFRSVEGFVGFEYRGRKYGMALTRLALLGATPPAVMDLAALREAVAASQGQPFAASAPEDVPGADPAPGKPSTQEGAGMDLAKLREVLGLPADASDDEVTAAVAALLAIPPTPTVDKPADDKPAATTRPAGDKPEPQPTEPSKQLVEIAAAANAVVLDSGVWKQAQEQIAQGVAAANQLREMDRDNLLNAATADGRIPPANRASWAAMWDKDPKGTTAVIASLKRNTVPISASGYAGGDDDDAADPYDALFPPTTRKGR